MRRGSIYLGWGGQGAVRVWGEEKGFCRGGVNEPR